MQLKPCRGVRTWMEPRNQEFELAYTIQSHSNRFDVIMLEENYGQDEDKIYAD